jgi:hypothetical protein
MINRFGKLRTLLIIACLSSVFIASVAAYMIITSTNTVTVTNGNGSLPTLLMGQDLSTVYTGDTLHITATLSNGQSGVPIQFFANTGSGYTSIGSTIDTDGTGKATYTVSIDDSYPASVTYKAEAHYPHP